MKLTSSIKASILGYILIVTSLCSTYFIINIVSINFFGKPPIEPIDTKLGWLGEVIGYTLISGSIIVGRYFGRVSYLGVAICIFIISGVLPQILGYYILQGLIPKASQELAQISILTPWYIFILPSLVAVLTLYAYNYITKKSTSRVSHAGRA